MWLLTYGIEPLLESEITKVLKSSCYCMSVDESLDKIFQLEQMSLNVRFWDDELGVVKVKYIVGFLNIQMWKTLIMRYTLPLSQYLKKKWFNCPWMDQTLVGKYLTYCKVIERRLNGHLYWIWEVVHFT